MKVYRSHPKNKFWAGTLTSGYQNNHFWPYFGLGAKVKVPYLRDGKADHPNFLHAVGGHLYVCEYQVSSIWLKLYAKASTLTLNFLPQNWLLLSL